MKRTTNCSLNQKQKRNQKKNETTNQMKIPNMLSYNNLWVNFPSINLRAAI